MRGMQIKPIIRCYLTMAFVNKQDRKQQVLAKNRKSCAWLMRM